MLFDNVAGLEMKFKRVDFVSRINLKSTFQPTRQLLKVSPSNSLISLPENNHTSKQESKTTTSTPKMQNNICIGSAVAAGQVLLLHIYMYKCVCVCVCVYIHFICINGSQDHLLFIVTP